MQTENRKAAFRGGDVQRRFWCRGKAYQYSETWLQITARRKITLENRKFCSSRSLHLPRSAPSARASSPLLTQHQNHLAAQTVVDMEGLLAVVIFLPVPGVGADNRSGHNFRHSSEKPSNSIPKTRVAHKLRQRRARWAFPYRHAKHVSVVVMWTSGLSH